MRKSSVVIIVISGCLCLALASGILLNRPTPMTLSNAEASPVVGQPETAHVYLQLENGDAPDRLLSASSHEAASVNIVGVTTSGSLVIPANGTPSLSKDGAFLVLSGIEGPLDEGRLIPISLKFDRSGTAKTRARINSSPADPHARHQIQTEVHETQTTLHEAGEMPPDLELNVKKGIGGVWEVELNTRHFTFDPLTENPVHIPGHGHGHLYLNGLKLQRMYSETAEIGALLPGQYTVTVSLNTNTHQMYMDENGPVRASTTITVE